MTRIARTPTLTGATNPELPSPVLSVLSDVEVLDQDEFDRLEPDRWDRSNELIRAADGMAEIQGTADWATLLRRTEDLGEGEAVLVLFTYDEDAPGEFFLSLSSGDWESDDYRRWAIGIDEPNGIFATDVYLGTNYSSEPLAGHLSASPDTWYYALLAVDRGGEFIAMVWERDNPSEKAAAWRDMGPAWSGLPWEFIGQANRGVVYVDALTGISFGEIQRPALPSHLLNVLFLAEAGYDDDLDRLPSSGWLHEGQIRAANGLLEMTALAGSTTLLQRAPWAREGEGMLLLLKYDSDAEFAIGIESGEWNTPGFRGVGLTQDWVSWARGGATWVERRDLTGTSSPTPGTWYYVLLAVDEDGRFLVHVWERDRPSAASEAQWHLGEDWTGLEWYLWTDTARGKLYLDRYTELSFAQLR
jgi:hypothetical protein